MTGPSFGPAEWRAIAPFAAVIVSGIGVLLYETFSGDAKDAETPLWFSIFGIATALLASLMFWDRGAEAFGGALALDGIALFANLVCGLTAILTLLMAPSYLAAIGLRTKEFYPLILFTLGGMMLTGAARDLVVLFLGIEIMSFPAYVLAGVNRRDPRCGEASLKYFVLGAFATAFLLYGIALFWGATGATSYAGIEAALPNAPHLVLLAAVALVVVGLGFKVGVVPFHFWAPDVYQGSPTVVTALMTVGIKAAAIIAAARFFLLTLAPIQVEWAVVLWWLAALTMTLGNVVAIAQSNIKRMLAYSSIAHAGYLTAAIAAGTGRGGAAALFYLLGYAFMNLGAFAVVMAVGAKGDANELVSDYAGLGVRRPLLAGAMVLFLLSLMGIPPLVGFAAKLYVVEALINAGCVGLAIVLMLNSVVSGYYYLRVIMEMFMRDPVKEAPSLEPRPYLMTSVGLATIGTVFFGLFPDLALDFARQAFLVVG
jgi:NADH-quinone oxidoreductase subunit N